MSLYDGPDSVPGLAPVQLLGVFASRHEIYVDEVLRVEYSTTVNKCFEI